MAILAKILYKLFRFNTKILKENYIQERYFFVEKIDAYQNNSVVIKSLRLISNYVPEWVISVDNSCPIGKLSLHFFSRKAGYRYHSLCNHFPLMF